MRVVRAGRSILPHSIRRALAVVGVIGGALLACSSADALQSRGHVFESSFGAPTPGAVAVDEASGDLYAVDRVDERVDVFAPDGHGGYAFASEFKVHSPGAIAVDNSTSGSDPSRGDVYVVGAAEKEATPDERNFIYEYSPSAGQLIHKWSIFKATVGGAPEELELEDISGVSVDASGLLWVYWEEEGVIDAFAKEETKGGAPKLKWKPELKREPEIESRFECVAREGFAVAPALDAFYTAYERRSVSEECPGEAEETPDATVVAKLDGAAPVPGAVIPELDHLNTTGVAVDMRSSDVYLDNGSSVAAFNPEGVLIQRFGAAQLDGASGIAVDGATGQVFVAEPAKGQVDVFGPEQQERAPVVDELSAQNLTPQSAELRAQIDPGGNETEYRFLYGTLDCAQNPGACSELPVSPGTIAAGFGDREVSVEVSGLQPATAYYYRVLASSPAGTAQADPATNTFTTLPSPGVLPDARAWEMVSPADKHGAALVTIERFTGGSIQASLDGNSLAWLASGPVVSEPEGSRSFEPTQLLSSRGSEAWSSDSLETPHDQGRGLLQPSPSEYHFFTPDLSLSLLQPTEPTRQVGGAVEHPPLSPQATEKTMYLRHSPPGSPDYLPLITAVNDAAGTQFGGALEFLGASSDLSHVVFESKVGLTASAPAAPGLYEWSTDGSLQLVSVLPDGSPAPVETGGLVQEPSLGNGSGMNDRNAISTDGQRVLWSENRRFVPEALYLRDSSTGETIKVNAAQGQGSTEPGPGGATLAEPGEEQQEVHFQSASSDGARILFTDTARLSEESSADPTGEESPADLYEFEVTSSPGEPLRGRLRDLTPDPTAGSADVLNLIPGAGQDGSEVYFVANGVLAVGATPGRCARAPEGREPPPPSATCNLYVSEPDPQHPGQRQTRLITKLATADAADWGSGLSGSGHTANLPPSQDLSAVTSRVSPNGQHLAFMSARSITGYDSADAVSGEPDEEVYLYDAASGRLSCASCNPNGSGAFERPHGVFDTRLGHEGLGLLVDRPEIWQDRWLAGSVPGWGFNITNSNPSALYQPRYLSDSGRLFFNSADALVPADQNGLEDVYEYEPGAIGSCASSGGCLGLISSATSGQESAFMDASQSGNDVFFQTSAQLVAADSDKAFDIYDARVCSAGSPCLSSTVSSSKECESLGTCRPSGSSGPAQVEVPLTSTFAGPPSISSAHSVLGSKTPKPPAKQLTRKQKLAKALKACRKIKRKHKRALCERRARKRYQPAKKAAAKKSAASSASAIARSRA